jgi:hypothetical protein
LFEHEHIDFLPGLAGSDLSFSRRLGGPEALIDPLNQVCGCLLTEGSHHPIRQSGRIYRHIAYTFLFKPRQNPRQLLIATGWRSPLHLHDGGALVFQAGG